MKPTTMALSGQHPACTVTVLVLLLQVILSPTADASCACKNGGQAYLATNIFGNCRCRCFGVFRGPRCQFVRKRGGQGGGKTMAELEELWSKAAREMIDNGGVDLGRGLDGEGVLGVGGGELSDRGVWVGGGVASRTPDHIPPAVRILLALYRRQVEASAMDGELDV